MKTFKQVFDSLSRSPIKSTLTLLTVGLGVGVLILVLSMTTSIRDNVGRQLADEGFVLMVANADPADDGGIAPIRPPEFDAGIVQTLQTEVEGIVAVTTIQSPPWQDFLANDRQYRVRSAVAGTEQYAEVMELDLVAGSYFTSDDVENGFPRALVTRGLATALFGDSSEAIGEKISVPTPTGGGGGFGGGRRFSPPSFVVTGVVEDPTEIMRKAYGIGDLIVPFTAIFPQGVNFGQFINFFYGTLAVRVRGTDIETATAQIRAALARSYGDDVSVMVWEGTVQGESSYLGDLRGTISNFALVGNILGFVLLAVASIGIMSIMLVEAIGRTRDIALERALGASNRRIVGEYFTRSVIISVLAGIVGTIISLVLNGPLSSLIEPIFAGFGGLEVGGIISPIAILVALGAAAFLGGVFGTFPVFSVLRTPISEGIRDV